MPKDQLIPEFPDWVPNSVARYVAHTEQGVSIRALARRDGCHASTVLRQIRKLETMREDPLVDAALARLRDDQKSGIASPLLAADADGQDLPEEAVLRREGMRVLRRLCETGAVLAVASDMENAVVVRDGGTRTAVVTRQIAQAMALKDWICATQVGRISRYAITPAGRAALREMLAEAENSAQGFLEAQNAFEGGLSRFGSRRIHHGGRARQVRFNLTESPLTALARRRGKDGARFLSEDLVAAGERLREDFELAQMGPRAGQNWERFLSGPRGGSYQPDGDAGHGSEIARQRVVEALGDWGVGLGDIALRCCCYLEGLEAAEKRLGWSARSGKIVLRIALMRLRDFYQAHKGGAGDYIG
ncbi:DUF6456 domain-containing protein [Shimia sp. R9_3]|uniref:DUF6456 domain-containing protein n=1 Tax=Shimia sp. R9_3 TaxID=2821113 RepID=UPI001ADBE3BC|nr:DUF6456 domain-containing protein [Shimia sp. R9_3]MBO9400820.1 helix-turn-helix domain-containing protein [Shimia sp. R9_3]